METLCCWKLECPKFKRDAYLTFSITETTTLASVKKEGIITGLKKCSLCSEVVCSTCSIAAEFTNQPVNLK